jgi:hypothetical protein
VRLRCCLSWTCKHSHSPKYSGDDEEDDLERKTDTDKCDVNSYLPAYSLVARAHGDAVLNGTLIPGEQQIL